MSIVYDYTGLAVNIARREYVKSPGKRAGVSWEDARGAALVELADAAQRYDRSRGTVRALLENIIPRAVWRLFRKQRVEEVPLTQEKSAPPSQPDALRMAAVERWVGNDEKRRALVQALEGSARLSSLQRALLGDLRATVGAEEPTSKGLDVVSAARALKVPDRHVRRLCDSGALRASRDGQNNWRMERRDVSRYRRRQVGALLEQGQTYRQARAAARCSLRTVHRAARAAGIRRDRGRPARQDHSELRALLTDPTYRPEFWHAGLPNIRRIAEAAGVPYTTAYRATL